MAQVINTNIAALNTRRSMDRSQSQLGISLQRLSTGSRINSAKDDAAGLAVSERMTSQIRGMSQSRRNINDAISMVQTSESALAEMGNLFQRGRELSVQAANPTNSALDKAAMQQEVDQLIAEVDRISTTAQFNGIKMFDGGSRNVVYDQTTQDAALTQAQNALIDQIKGSWLQQGEEMISTYFGISADNADISIEFVEGQPYLAAVNFSGYESGSGKLLNMTLNIDLNDFMPSDGVNGGPSFVSNDRILMHELTHAVMGRTTNMEDLPLWFVEGAAEFIHGADDRLNTDLAAASGATNADKVASLMTGSLTDDGSTEQYSAGYAAVRFLHSNLIAAGGTGIREVFDYLEANSGSDLNDAIVAMKAAHSGLAFGTQAQLEGLFDSGEAGNTYVVNLMTSGSLTNADTGAVGGADADGGSRDTSASGVVPDVINPTNNPLANFNESFPGGTPGDVILASVGSFAFQVGANVGEVISIDKIAINSGNLGIDAADLLTDAEQAITRFDRAMSAVNRERARLGALQNRFDSASNAIDISIESASASRSRITDTDFAAETAMLVRQQILQQAGTSILAQANQVPQVVLSLLR